MRKKVKAAITATAVVAAVIGVAGPGAAWQKVVHPLYTDGVAIVAQASHAVPGATGWDGGPGDTTGWGAPAADAQPGATGWDGLAGGCTTSWGCPA